MLQAFHWDTPADGSQWNEIGARAAELARTGFTALWLPPFAVGEYFTGNVATPRWFIDQTGRRLSLYHFPLHFNLRDLGRGSSNIDMRRVFDGTLVAQDPVLAVTFVDNHDTWQGCSP